MRLILGDNYVSYEASLEMCGLETLSFRRNKRQLKFALKCVKSDFNKSMFPLNSPNKKEKFKVNFARTESYFNSAIPQCQRALNCHYQKQDMKNKINEGGEKTIQM